MGIVAWFGSAVQWVRTLLDRKVCTADRFREAVESSLMKVDADGDELVSVRELIGFIIRVI